MKRNRLLTALLSAVLLLAACAFTGCSTAAVLPGSSSSESSASESSASESSASSEDSSDESSEESSKESSSTGLGLYSSVGDYLADPAVIAELDGTITAMEGSGMAVTVTADGNTLVYTYTYETQLDIPDEDTLASFVDAMEEGLTEQASTFEGIAASLRTIISVDDIAVRLVYCNADGTELYSHTFE